MRKRVSIYTTQRLCRQIPSEAKCSLCSLRRAIHLALWPSSNEVGAGSARKCASQPVGEVVGLRRNAGVRLIVSRDE